MTLRTPPPEPHSRAKIRYFRDEVMKSLRDPDSGLKPDLRERIDQITEAEVEKALRWKGTQKQIDDDAKIGHICAYLPRNMTKWVTLTNTRHVVRPATELSPASAVGYAVATHLRPKTDPILRACREHYWGTSTPPFPWLDEEGSSQYQDAVAQAHRWLQEQSDKGGGRFDLALPALVASHQDARQRLGHFNEAMSSRPDWHEAGRSVSDLLRILADSLEGLDITVPNSFRFTFVPQVDLNWSGPLLEVTGLNRVPVRVHQHGLLESLWKTTCTVARLSHWWNEKQALELLLTGHPPQPLSSQLNNASRSFAEDPSQRRRKRPELSYTHLGLVQLAYLYPDERPPQWLARWDQWCQSDKNRSALNSFVGKRGKTPYTASGRLTQFRRELSRAMQRALQFQPRGEAL